MDRTAICSDIPADGLETPHGRLYRPQSQARQILILIAAFFASMSLGGLIAAVPGDLSSGARVVFHIPYVLVFFFGYGLWMARINAIVFDTIGRSILRVLWQIIAHRKRPDDAAAVLPSREKVVEILVRCQKSGASFRAIGWLVALLSLPLGFFPESSMRGMPLIALLAVTTIAWGALLGVLGRRGWLPFPETE